MVILISLGGLGLEPLSKRVVGALPLGFQVK